MTMAANVSHKPLVQAQVNTPSNTSPAKAAREYRETHPDAAEQPFGKLVSMFAKGEPLSGTV